jgi:hypothetical protein
MYLENTFYFIFFGIGQLVGHKVILTTIKNPGKKRLANLRHHPNPDLRRPVAQAHEEINQKGQQPPQSFLKPTLLLCSLLGVEVFFAKF